MNILHTSDLHIGKRLMDRERLPEQREVLLEIVQICERERVDVVLIAGDVFDTYMPSAEAEDLFFHFVKELAGDGRAVVIVSGNHDDGTRLSAASPLAREQGIYIFGNHPANIPQNQRRVRVVEAGDYYLILQNEKGESVYINALPYPNEARFKESKTEESFSQKMERWIARGEEGYRGDMPHVLLSHLFVAGGASSASERDIELGGARAVPVSCLPKEGYVALGHLHKKQKFGEKIRYSGSILQYSFDEANTQKSVVLLKTYGLEFQTEEIPLTTGKKLIRLEANNYQSALQLLGEYQDCFIELTLRLQEPLTSSETQSLRERNEGLVSLLVSVNAQNVPVAVSRAQLSAKELFCEYFRSNYGEDPSSELTAAFLQLLEENG